MIKQDRRLAFLRSVRSANGMLSIVMLCGLLIVQATLASEGTAVASKIIDIADPGNIAAIAFSANGETLAINVVDEQKVDIWSLRGHRGRLLRSFSTPEGVEMQIGSSTLIYNPNGRMMALLHDSTVMGEGTRVDVWNLASGDRVRILHPPDKESTQIGLAAAPDGRHIFALFRGPLDEAADQFVAYNNDWSIKWGLKTRPFWPSALAISPDGNIAAVGGVVDVYRYAPIWLIDLRAHRVVRQIDAFPADVGFAGLAFSPDGKRLAASASFNNVKPDMENLKVFSVSSGDQISGTLSPDQSQIRLSYAGNGEYLVDGALEGTATIRDGALKTQLQKIKAVMGVFAVSPDGYFLAVATETGASIWEIRPGSVSALHRCAPDPAQKCPLLGV